MNIIRNVTVTSQEECSICLDPIDSGKKAVTHEQKDTKLVRDLFARTIQREKNYSYPRDLEEAAFRQLQCGINAEAVFTRKLQECTERVITCDNGSRHYLLLNSSEEIVGYFLPKNTGHYALGRYVFDVPANLYPSG